jgi:CheY-like chemotaxis protein
VKLVRDGNEAWEALQSDAYDLLITDNDMPGLTGLELVTKTRLNGLDLPVILATGSAELIESSSCEWLNFGARLQKPFGPIELLKSVQDVLSTANATRLHPLRISPRWSLND